MEIVNIIKDLKILCEKSQEKNKNLKIEKLIKSFFRLSAKIINMENIEKDVLILIEESLNQIFNLKLQYSIKFNLFEFLINYNLSTIYHKIWNLNKCIKYMENSINNLNEYLYKYENNYLNNICIKCCPKNEILFNKINNICLYINYLFIKSILHLQNIALQSQNNLHYNALSESINCENMILTILIIVKPLIKILIKAKKEKKLPKELIYYKLKENKKKHKLLNLFSLDYSISKKEDLENMCSLESFNTLYNVEIACNKILKNHDYTDFVNKVEKIPFFCTECSNETLNGIKINKNQGGKEKMKKDIYYNKTNNLNFYIWKLIPENNSKLLENMNNEINLKLPSWLLNFNIGHLMHLFALDYQFLCYDYIFIPHYNFFINIILLLASGLFSKSTEKKFLLLNEDIKNDKYSNNIKQFERNMKLCKNEDFWSCERIHFRSVEILKTYWGESAILTHIINSYKNNYSEILYYIVNLILNLINSMKLMNHLIVQ